MRIALLSLVLSLLYTGGCGDSESCIKTNIVCLDRETPDNLVMHGEWKGTYDVGRHNLGTNDMRLSWYGSTYLLRVDRDHALREPFYRTDAFKGYGSLTEGQNKFRAPYSVDEVWHLHGRYYLDDQQIVYKGWITANGRTIGDFRLSRNRQCSAILRQKENVCIEEIDRSAITPNIEQVAVSPNPVSASTTLTLAASASPAAEWKWAVSLSPATAPTLMLGNWELQAENFQVDTTAPALPGEYVVTFTVTGNGQTDVKEETLTVLP